MHSRYVRSQLGFQRAELLFGDIAVVIDLTDLLCGQIFRRGDGIKAMAVNGFLKPFSAKLYSGGILGSRQLEIGLHVGSNFKLAQLLPAKDLSPDFLPALQHPGNVVQGLSASPNAVEE